MLSLDGLFVSQKAIHLVVRIVCVYCLIEKIAFLYLVRPSTFAIENNKNKIEI